MFLYENLLCLYDVIMIYLKICWFYFIFFIFFQDWYRHEIYSALSVEQAIETKYGWALQLFRKLDCLFKKNKKSTTDYITRNSKFKPHCQHKKWGKR